METMIVKAFGYAISPDDSVVHGCYYCPVQRKNKWHWWYRKPDGLIYDPSTSCGRGIYDRFSKWELI